MEDLESDSPDTKCCQLLEHILHTLTQCFTYDKGSGFLTKDRFDALMQPLVDQVRARCMAGWVDGDFTLVVAIIKALWIANCVYGMYTVLVHTHTHSLIKAYI